MDNDSDFYPSLNKAVVAAAQAAAEAKLHKPKRGRPPKMELPGQSLTPDTNKQFKGHSASPITTQNGNRRSQLHHMDDIEEDMKPSKSGGSNSKFLEPGEIMRPSKLTTRSRGQPMTVDSGDNSDASSTSSSTFSNSKPQPPPPPPKHRSRKSFTSAPKEAPSVPPTPNFNQVDLAALAALFLAPGNDPDERISVINVEDGTRLQGNKAPKRGELAMWLLSHPNYLPDEQEIINMTMQSANMAALMQQQQQQSNSSNNKGGETSDDESTKTTTPTRMSSNRPGLRQHHESPQQQHQSPDPLPILFNKVSILIKLRQNDKKYILF